MDSGGKQAGHGQEGPSRCPNSYQINSIDVSVPTALNVSILMLGHHAPPSTMVKHWRLWLCKLAVGQRQHVSEFPIRRVGAGDMLVVVNVGSVLADCPWPMQDTPNTYFIGNFMGSCTKT